MTQNKNEIGLQGCGPLVCVCDVVGTVAVLAVVLVLVWAYAAATPCWYSGEYELASAGEVSK